MVDLEQRCAIIGDIREIRGEGCSTPLLFPKRACSDPCYLLTRTGTSAIRDAVTLSTRSRE